MARVKITLSCTNCGQPFEHIHFCRNSTEAASYETWARENITICPDCRAVARKEKEQKEIQAYLAGFEDTYPLPRITGVSEKQIAFAENLRSRFIAEGLMAHNVNVPKYFQFSDQIQFSKLSEQDLEKAAALAAQAGKSANNWFAEYRAAMLSRYARLPSTDYIRKIEVTFKETNAASVIDALR